MAPPFGFRVVDVGTDDESSTHGGPPFSSVFAYGNGKLDKMSRLKLNERTESIFDL